MTGPGTYPQFDTWHIEANRSVSRKNSSADPERNVVDATPTRRNVSTRYNRPRRRGNLDQCMAGPQKSQHLKNLQ